MKVYGCKISYYTGKLETYLRYRGLPYTSLGTVGNEDTLIEGAGVVQMPVVQLGDGRWMTDTTPVIQWFESEQSREFLYPGSIYPEDPALNFIALLIEDYADEWLWRPAMHYRWSYQADRRYAAHAIYEDIVKGQRPFPGWLARHLITKRQLGGFVKGDGVSDKTWDHVEATYLKSLDLLQFIFAKRPFILGDTPTIADFGMMGPMLRHFSQDPTPAEIMRTRAPAVYEWVARMWNVKPTGKPAKLISKPDDLLTNLLAEISETHLAQLRQNADGFTQGLTRFNQEIQGCHYTNLPTSRYRVWCLEELRREWSACDKAAKTALQKHLQSPEASILWDEFSFAPSNYDTERAAPFNEAINVYGDGVP